MRQEELLRIMSKNAKIWILTIVIRTKTLVF